MIIMVLDDLIITSIPIPFLILIPLNSSDSRLVFLSTLIAY
ncbi:hypothetical protein F383_35905 [Gossypium arboreum]|uniref:Uncharacterized protein n=1 Tax=Gossypium arboreum TaxID=29729 RepID=A0A0B0N758_GOSAR|nr:hypothetical protein F383_35905 [Gossypium arboreum]